MGFGKSVSHWLLAETPRMREVKTTTRNLKSKVNFMFDIPNSILYAFVFIEGKHNGSHIGLIIILGWTFKMVINFMDHQEMSS